MNTIIDEFHLFFKISTIFKRLKLKKKLTRYTIPIPNRRDRDWGLSIAEKFHPKGLRIDRSLKFAILTRNYGI